MAEKIKQKKYFLQLKLIKKNKTEYINLINDTLEQIDKITSICYTKEKFLYLLHPAFIEYILENYDKADLLVTYKNGDFIKEIPTIQREERFMAYIDKEEIDKILFEKIINSKKVNGKKLTQADYFRELINVNYFYTKLNSSDLLLIHNGQLGKRVVIEVLLNMNLINDKNKYYPTIDDVKTIQDKLLEIYIRSIGYVNSHSQMLFEGFTSKNGVIREKCTSIISYDVFPYLKRLNSNPNAEYYIDKSYYPENFSKEMDIPNNIDSFEDFNYYEEKKEKLKNKIIKHEIYQKQVKEIYLEKIHEYNNRNIKVKVRS